MKPLKYWMLVITTLVCYWNIVYPVLAAEEPGIKTEDIRPGTAIKPGAARSVESMKPDLMIESFSVPAIATQSEIISRKINIVVKNIGESEAGKFIVAVILKGTVVNPGFPTQYHVLGYGTVANLGPGQSV